MKTEEQIDNARKIMREKLVMPGLSDMQRALFAGILNTLVWAAEGHSTSTLDRLLSGEPVAVGKDPTEAIKRLDQLTGMCPNCGYKTSVP